MEYTNSQIDRVINEHIHSERDRKILKARYIDGITLEGLSAMFDLSVKQVRNIIYKHESTLIKYLK